MDARLASNSACSPEPRALRQDFVPDRPSAAEASRFTWRASLLIALFLSVGLWTVIGAAIASLVRIVDG